VDPLHAAVSTAVDPLHAAVSTAVDPLHAAVSTAVPTAVSTATATRACCLRQARRNAAQPGVTAGAAAALRR